MTPKELAEKIESLIYCPDYGPHRQTDRVFEFRRNVESLLSDALGEARMQTQIQHNFYMVAIEQRDNAYEEAAKVASEFDGRTVNHPYNWVAVKAGIADKIRALKAGVK